MNDSLIFENNRCKNKKEAYNIAILTKERKILMKRNGGLLRRMGAGLRRFMQGRYGSDRLNMLFLGIGVIACLLSMLIPQPQVRLLLVLVSYATVALVLFRSLSRNVYKRYEENRKYLFFLDKLKDRAHKYYTCPRCRQPVRVPKGKGKIMITCPKCKEKFQKKT